MAHPADRKPPSPVTDPVYDFDRAEILFRLYGGERVMVETAKGPAERLDLSPRMRDLALWDRTCPVLPHHRPVDDVVAAMVRKQWIADATPWRDGPHHAVRMAIADAAEEATRHWRSHAAARALKAFADALQVVGATLADPHVAGAAAGLLAIDFDRLPPRHFQAVATHALQDRTAAIEADFAAVMTALGPVRPMIERIAAQAGDTLRQVRPSNPVADPWKRVFAAELTRAWRLMVKEGHGQPSSSEASQHQKFIVAAYQSLGGTQSKSFASSVRSLMESGELAPEPLHGT